MFERIVVGFDGSETAERGLRLTCKMAQQFKSDIHVVHTPEPQTVAFAMGAVAGYHAVTTMPSSKEVTKAAEKVVEAANAVAKEYDLAIKQAHIEHGDPAEAIVACAEKCGADLIVTGRRGLGTLGALMQGSTSARINHLAKCASLSVV
ncbi:MAG: universal stress protein [Sulfitobacter sp.]